MSLLPRPVVAWRPRSGAVGFAVAVALGGCTSLLAPPQVMPDGGEIRGFQDCEPPFVFQGESTMAALGIEAEGLTHELTMSGHIRITRDTVTHAEFAPRGAPVIVPEGQLLCVEWPGGGGMAMMLRQPWPTPDQVGDASTVAAPLAIVFVAIVLGAMSWIAFRRGSSTP